MQRSQGAKLKIASRTYAMINKIADTLKDVNVNEYLFMFIFFITFYIDI